MTEVVASAFFSYAHSDNDRENGRILRLAEKIRDEFETLTGTTIELFDDNQGISWGDDFRQRLDEALQKTTFFIPVLTATYFLREECRKEMFNFVSSAKALGLEELMLSIRYAPVPDLREDSTDELKAISAAMQFEPWEPLRLVDEDSALYRAAVNKLAERLVFLTKKLEATPTVPAPILHSVSKRSTKGGSDNYDEDDDEAPGLLDLVADTEPAMEAWTQTISGLSEAFDPFNAVFSLASEKMNEVDAKPNAFATKIVIARNLAVEIEPHLELIEGLSKDYSTGVMRLDSSIHALFSMAAQQDDSADLDEFLSSLRGLIAASKDAMSGVRGSADAARANGKLSRDLRPVLRRFEAAMRAILDGQNVIDGWEALIMRAEGASSLE